MAPQGDTTNAKQLIVGRVQQSTNILVAVGANPSIDSLAAALALSLMLNKLDKHATAVFSGQIPDVMKFLNPEKTFENNVNSLRDFIISLDKEKADRLRYKLEKDVVKIFITPYRTTITQADLQFSEGDFNVDLVVALGVEKREDLDQAVVAHGRILHDATVVTINANGQQSNLGAVDWNDPNASSLCEMLVALNEAFQKPGMLDAQIANALLTGIVAATDRFSNQHTTSKVMTMAAQLMAAGADQQLVALNMQKPEQPVTQPAQADESQQQVGENGELDIKHPEGEKAEANPEEKPAETEQSSKPGSSGDIANAEAELDAALPKPEPPADADKSLDELKNQLEEVAKTEPEPTPEVQRKFVDQAPAADTSAPAAANDAEQAAQAQLDQAKNEKSPNSWRGHRLEPPTMGGSLSSTSEDALQEKLHAEEDQRNHQLLSHGAGQAEQSQPDAQTTGDQPATTPASDAQQPAQADVEDARKAVGDAIGGQEFSPAGNPRSDVGSQPMPNAPEPQPYIPLEPAAPPAAPQPSPSQPATLPTDTNGLPIIPPMPALPTEDPGAQPNLPPMPPPLPPLPGSDQPPNIPPPTTDPNQPTDPGQFKIPGQ